MIEIHARLDFNLDADDILKKFGFEDHGRVQKAIDKSVIDYNMAYWAFDTGTLARSAYTASDIGSGLVTYPGPYAHYMYYGQVYGPNIPVERDSSGNVIAWRSPKGKKKHPTGRPIKYKTDRNALAGSFPFERMKADHLNDILEEARRVARDE